MKRIQKIAPEIPNWLRLCSTRAQKLRNIDVLSQKNFGECISEIGVGASKKTSPPRTAGFGIRVFKLVNVVIYSLDIRRTSTFWTFYIRGRK